MPDGHGHAYERAETGEQDHGERRVDGPHARFLGVPGAEDGGDPERRGEATPSPSNPARRRGGSGGDGRRWYADPEAHVFAGEYWVYPTTSAPYDDQTYMDAFSSPDLLTWTKHPRSRRRVCHGPH